MAELPRPDSNLTPTAPARRTSLRGLIWPLALSLGALLLIGYFTYEPGALQQMWTALHPGLLLAALGTIILRIVAGGWRLRYISGNQFSLMTGIRGQLIWDFASNITPSAIGGGPVVAFSLASESKIKVGDATAVMLFAMLTDQIGFSLFIPFILAASFFTDAFPNVGVVGTSGLAVYFLGMMLWTGAFAYATLLRPELLQKFLDKVFRIKWLRRFSARVHAESDLLTQRAATLRTKSVGFFVVNVFVGMITWLCRFALLFFLVWSVVPDLQLFQFFVRIAALLMTSLAIPTPGASGGLEGLFALFLGPLMPDALMVPVLLTWRFLAYYLFIIIGIGISSQQMRRVAERRNGTNDTAPAGDGAATTATVSPSAR